MTLSVLAYMAAYTSISLNFMQENYSLLYKDKTTDGVHYEACKPLWWDYVTELGEVTILIFGIHLSYASRNAKTQFHVSRTYLRPFRNKEHENKVFLEQNVVCFINRCVFV